jgi:hypothetical protein
MTPDAVAVAVMVILLFPTGYFTLASRHRRERHLIAGAA